jgi:mono/diheme cytochrome c family protein
MKRLVDVVQILALLAAVVFVVALFANEPDSSADTPAAGPPDGAAVFASNCAGCHGPSGGGGVGPALAGGAVVDAFPDEADQIAVVTDGRGGMPAFGGRLSADEIEAVVAYTRNDL